MRNLSLFLIIIVLFSLLITPLICNLLIFYFVELPWPFARVFNRVILGSVLICFAYTLFRNPKKINFENIRKNLSWKNNTIFVCFLFLSAITTIAVVPWIVDQSYLVSDPRTLTYLFGRVPKILIAASLIALIEEAFFRQYLFGSILKSKGMLFAFFITNIIYAVVHFLKPDKTYNYSGGWLEGFNYFYSMLLRSIDLQTLKAVFALFLVGLILSYARYVTNTIFYSIALHIGWIFGIKYARYTSTLPAGLDYPIGTGREYYLLTFYQAWLAIILVGICVYLILPKRLISDQSGSIT